MLHHDSVKGTNDSTGGYMDKRKDQGMEEMISTELHLKGHSKAMATIIIQHTKQGEFELD